MKTEIKVIAGFWTLAGILTFVFALCHPNDVGFAGVLGAIVFTIAASLFVYPYR